MDVFKKTTFKKIMSLRSKDVALCPHPISFQYTFDENLNNEEYTYYIMSIDQLFNPSSKFKFSLPQ